MYNLAVNGLNKTSNSVSFWERNKLPVLTHQWLCQATGCVRTSSSVSPLKSHVERNAGLNLSVWDVHAGKSRCTDGAVNERKINGLGIKDPGSLNRAACADWTS
ncbi:hypothetical protein GDO86_018756 [Hymenochirus boettgeri]|uniref:Uncharacterized protein n=1 Tax=Hymenochirus boettgeri TaxID=247094 RepID=A0A8T2IFJ7_9PIPI|nr:hypothetical protein GDO86_018756 [Hymenochirus boettgeri]